MKNLNLKLKHLNWLKSIGIEYYCSYGQKDRKKNLIDAVKDLNKKIEQRLSTVDTCSDLTENEGQYINKIREYNVPKKTISTNLPQNIQESVAKARALADKANDIGELRLAVENFDGCELKQFAMNTVFAAGVLPAQILLVGEAPGETEDRLAIPFCGESGKLLDEMLKSIGISRMTNAYITNTVFWRPPANRKPTNEEIAICKPFVEKHVALVKPKLIILVGSTACTSLLGKNEAMATIRIGDYQYSNPYLEKTIPTTIIFHPAYLLRQPNKKKDTWFDLLKIKNLIESLT